jgi:hypothetical protein
MSSREVEAQNLCHIKDDLPGMRCVDVTKLGTTGSLISIVMERGVLTPGSVKSGPQASASLTSDLPVRIYGTSLGG